MVEQSGSGRVGVRFGTYVDELRAFFASRGVRFGSPEDLVGFAERVASPGAFQDEMGSLVRSIHFQEGDNLGRGEMLELVSVAVGGPEVERAAQEMHASVRQIFVFVNEALRQRQWAFPEEVSEPGEQAITASHILKASSSQRNAEDRAVGRVPGNGSYSGTDAPRGEEAGREVSRSSPGGSGILFKAVSMSEEESAHAPYGEAPLPLSRRPWFIPTAVAGVVVLAAAAYVGTTAANHSSGTGAAIGGASQTQLRPTSAAACVAPASAEVSRAGLQDRSRWAHGLLDQKMYEAALPELRQIAQVDPGYPGINLDESDALLQLKRPEDARDAVDAQIGISECLAKLPSVALDAYCTAEFTPSTVGGCRAQLAHIRQAAELQAALVHLELGHRDAPEGSAPEPAATDATRPFTTGSDGAGARLGAGLGNETGAGTPRAARVRRPVLPPATDGDSDAPATTRSVAAAKASASPKRDRKSDGDDALKHGDGTDSAFGAYSKPQE